MSDFLRPFFVLKANVKLPNSQNKEIEIDNLAFRLHYRVTAILLFVCTALVTSRQYIGEHIKCIVGHALNPRIISSYCFFTSTFTVLKHVKPDLVRNDTLPHLGVGPYVLNSNSTDLITKHNYYQWVPFMLFIQAIMFILTHLLWKKWEGGKLKALLMGLENAHFAFQEKNFQGGKGPVPSIEQKRRGIALIRENFISSHYVSKFWAIGLITCECLNLLHVLFQIYLTDKFLGGIFWSLGPELLDDSQSSKDILDAHFPKVTKCSFQKYGPSGSMQIHDVLCVMALNVMNEKIYSVLWFWFWALFVVSFLNLLWRFSSIFMHKRSTSFNRYVFKTVSEGTLTELTLTDSLEYKDWIFLKYLGRNVEEILFREILDELTEGVRHKDYSVKNPDELYKLNE